MPPTPQRPPRIALLCIGTELLSGQINTHQSTLAVILKDLGLSFSRAVCLPDDEKAIAQEVRRSLGECDVLLICGGLGPTFDDITRQAVAAALRRPLEYRPKLYAVIKKKFALRRLPIPAENRRQAFVISGARPLANKTGSAPGQILTLPAPARACAAKTVVLLPGPFSELWPMFHDEVLPYLKKTCAAGISAQHLVVHMAGIPESLADEKLAPLIADPHPGVSFTILALSGQVDFHATVVAGTQAKAARRLQRLRARIYQAVGDYIFGEQGQTLESALGRRLREKGMTLSIAESCTAGLLSERITAAPGSSDYFLGGVVAYSNNLKMSLLDVASATIAKHGAVSAQAALEMAQGVRRLCGASLGVSITGIAGPAGGTRAKPVGLVYIGLRGPGRAEAHWKLRLSGDRQAIRQRAAAAALGILLHRLN